MKKQTVLRILLLSVLILILAVLLYDAGRGGIWILTGLDGKDGKSGTDGKSAYELALEDGFEGTLHEWLLSLSLQGERGKDGVNGINGTNGTNGKDGKDGTGVRDAKVDPANGHLLLTLTDGTILDAGYVGGEGYSSGVVDADGFTETYEFVVMNQEASQLNLRDAPDTANGKIVTTAKSGQEFLRVGRQETENGFSRLIWDGHICYARSRYFDLKYIYEGAVPDVCLPDRLVLTAGVQMWFVNSEIVPRLPDGMSISYSYSGKGSRVYDEDKAFALTPEACDKEETLLFRIETEENGNRCTVCEKRIAIRVVNERKDAALCGVVIGDSRISDGTIVTKLTNDLQNLTLLGTRTVRSSGVSHEGRGAWSTNHYLNYKSVTVGGEEVPNAFYDPAKQKFDFSYYMAQNAPDAKLDFVVINLGANDGFLLSAVSRLQEMVASIQSYANANGRNIAVFIMTEYLSPASGYYLTQSSDADLAATRAKQFAFNTELKKAFGGREDEAVYLIPNYLCINDWSDRFRSVVTTESGDTEKIVDAVHLGLAGYRKEATMIETYLYAYTLPDSD